MAVVFRLTVLVVPVRTTRWAMKRSRNVGRVMVRVMYVCPRRTMVRIIVRVMYLRRRWTVIRIVDFDCTWKREDREHRASFQ